MGTCGTLRSHAVLKDGDGSSVVGTPLTSEPPAPGPDGVRSTHGRRAAPLVWPRAGPHSEDCLRLWVLGIGYASWDRETRGHNGPRGHYSHEVTRFRQF